MSYAYGGFDHTTWHMRGTMAMSHAWAAASRAAHEDVSDVTASCESSSVQSAETERGRYLYDRLTETVCGEFWLRPLPRVSRF